MTVLPHQYRLQFGAGAPPGPCCPEKIAFARERRSLRETAKRFMEFRRAAHAADQSVDVLMRRGDTTTRFYYFGEGETP